MKHPSQRQVLMLALGTCILLPSIATAQISNYPDSAVEQCLMEGELGKRMDTLVGATKPRRLEIGCSIEMGSAVFKDVDDHRRGLPAKVGGIQEMNFSDCYKYERAAYLLDRELGLNMVPVAVLRQYKRSEGALVEWISNASHESQMTRALTGTQVAALAQRKSVMRLFDALILNVDRRQENWLVDQDTFELYLIDHSRAFRIRKSLPPEFTGQVSRMNRRFYDDLAALDEERLTELMGDLVTRQQIHALMARRDLILQKIDEDVLNHGPAVIFTDWQDTQATIEVASSDLD